MTGVQTCALPIYGTDNAGLIAIGALKKSDEKIGNLTVNEFAFKIEIPGFLSIMTTGDRNAYVPGIRDYIHGNREMGILSAAEKMERGRHARDVLFDYKKAKEADDTEAIALLRTKFDDPDFIQNYFAYFGYAFLNAPEDIVPNVPIAFYSFHIMVVLGFFFLMLFTLSLFFVLKGDLEKHKWFLYIALWSLPLPYIASELGWVVAEMGRQPWIIQDLMPVSVAVSHLSASSVKTTFFMFAILFTALLIAEISIMVRQIKSKSNH